MLHWKLVTNWALFRIFIALVRTLPLDIREKIIFIVSLSVSTKGSRWSGTCYISQCEIIAFEGLEFSGLYESGIQKYI